MATSPNSSGGSSVEFSYTPLREGDTIPDKVLRELAERLLGAVDTVQVSNLQLKFNGGTTSTNEFVSVDQANGQITIVADFNQIDTIDLRLSDGTKIEQQGGIYTIPLGAQPQSKELSVSGDGDKIFEFDSIPGTPGSVTGIPTQDPVDATYFLKSVSNGRATFSFSGVTDAFTFKAVAV